MLPFTVDRGGPEVLSQQIVYAATRAIVSGELRPGDAFPSVRQLSRELDINPNTSAKAVAELIGRGLLRAESGVGAFVAETPPISPRERRKLLSNEVERLVVEAKRLGVARAELTRAIDAHWTALFGTDDGAAREPSESGPRSKQ